MAKKLDDESGELVKGKGARPELVAAGKPPRGFPFRLLFWAMLMTVAAGAGGYFTYKYRDQWKDKKHAAELCETQKGDAVKAEVEKAKLACETQLQDTANQFEAKTAELTAKSKEADAQLTKMSENLNTTKDELEQLRTQKVEAERRAAAMDEIRKKIEEITSLSGLKVTARRGSLVVELPSEVLFESAKADLSRKGEVTVLQVGGVLAKVASDRRFLVVGHTDSQQLKSSQFKDNWELSVARALTVTRYLVEGGMDAKNVIASGAGENDPIADNKTQAGQARNRRIEIQLLPALSELPPLPDSLADKPTEPKGEKNDDKKDDKKDDK